MFWDMKTKSATPVTGKGHSNQVMKLVDSGNTVLSVGMDDTLRLIDTSSHKFMFEISL